MSGVNRRFVLNARPVGEVKESDLRYTELPVPDINEGQFLVEMEYIGVEPAMRGWMEDRESYVKPLQLGDLMSAYGVGKVAESRNSNFLVGERVAGMFGMQTHCVADGSGFPISKVDERIDSSTHIGVLALTGLTAYCGLHAIGKPKAGDTVFVSGAAGATGSVAGQLALLAGCRVIGTAGSDEKCRWLEQELGFAAAINYKTEDVAARTKALCPDGMDIYWDNVGGELLDIALNNLAKQARIVLCGGISRYNATGALPGPENYFNLIFKNASMTGFVVSDYQRMFGEAVAALSEHLLSGKLKHTEDILEGFENTPRAIIRLFRGENTGKQMVRV